MKPSSTNPLRLTVKRKLQEAAFVKLLLTQTCADVVERMAEKVIAALRQGKAVYLFGNGGSAADAQHVAAELQGKFYKARRPLPVLALTTNTSLLTAVGNDFGYAHTFSRQVEAHTRKGDVVIAISTSGDSANVLEAVKVARRKGAFTVGWTGRRGGKLAKLVHLCLHAPSDDVARIQECHTTVGHILCELVETALFR